MKTVTGRVISAEPITLSKAATLLSGFASSENGATQAVSAYLRRSSAAFTELKSIHREINSSSFEETKPRADARRGRNPTGESDELGRAKGIADLVENGGKLRCRKSETVSEEESIYGREKDEIKEEKKKKKNKKSKKKKEEDVVDGKVNEKLKDEQRNEERKEEKKKKKRKSDGDMGSEESKIKKKRKSKGIDG